MQKIVQRSILSIIKQDTLVRHEFYPAEQFDNVRVVNSGQIKHFPFEIDFAVALKLFHGSLGNIFLNYNSRTCRPLSPLHFIHGAKMSSAHLAFNLYFARVHTQPFVESIQAICI
jgi:hypothetical protein